MSRQSGRFGLAILLGTLLTIIPLHASSRGEDVSFRAFVTGIQQASSGEATVSFRVAGFVLPVRITAETDIEIDGNKLSLGELQVGDFAKVEGFFSDSGIVAKDVEILDRRGHGFRIRGVVSDVRSSQQGITITVLGVQVLLDAGTRTGRRGNGAGIPASAIAPGMEVDVRGIFRDPDLVATRIVVGHRDDEGNEVKFEGIVQSVSSGRITVDTRGGGSAVVLIAGTTTVRGTLAVGKRVEVKGFLNESLEVVAVVVRVEGEGNTGGGDGEDDDVVLFAREIPLVRQIAGSKIEGKAEVEMERDSSGLEQEFEVEIEDADPNTGYRILVMLRSSRVIDFGALATDFRGKAKVKFSTDPKDDEKDLRPFLGAGEDVRQFAVVQVLLGNVTVLEGRF